MADTDLNISPDEKVAGVPLARLLRNLDETSYNEGAVDLACRLTDCKTVIEELLRGRATPPSLSTAPESSQFANRENGEAYNSRLTSEVDERAAFEARVTCLAPGHPLARNPNGRYSADCNEWAWDGWKARAALASRPRIKLAPELKAALDEAARTGATSAMLPSGGTVFINRGHDYGDNAHLECTACGGSGHIDDQRQIALASRPAEVDDEGLPPLPEPRAIRAGHGFPKVYALAYTAEQYRQGQRDAVAADRARRGGDDSWENAMKAAARICDEVLWELREAGIKGADLAGACSEAIREFYREAKERDKK